MGRFIRNITFYLIIPGIIAGILLEILLRNIPNSYSYKKKYLDNNSDSIQTLVLGGSTAYFNIDPAYLKTNCFNASNIAQSLDIDFEILKKYDRKWKNLKWIILPINYGSLFYRLEQNSGLERGRIGYYIIYYDLKTPHRLEDHFVLFNYKLRTSINRIIVYYLYKVKTVDYSVLGWGTQNDFKDKKDLNETGKYYGKLETFKDVRINDNLIILKSIIGYAKERNVKVFLYTEPAYHTFIENLDSNQLSQTIEAATSLEKTCQNVKYVNFLADSSFTERDFYDADHLDEYGAQKLTLKIDSVISSLQN